jgi:hypothetical protein
VVVSNAPGLSVRNVPRPCSHFNTVKFLYNHTSEVRLGVYASVDSVIR